MSIAEKLTTIAENQQKVYDAGAKSEYDKFWDNLQGEGGRRNYNYAFYGSYWTDENFRPKHDIITTAMTQCFKATGIQDVVACLAHNGVMLDTSKTTGFSYTFHEADITHLPTISTVGASKLDNTFASAAKLHTVDKLILKADGSQTFTTPFLSCSALQNIVIEGTIGNAISFSSSTKLTHDSLMSIIGALLDISATGTTKKLTLGTTNLGKLTAEEKQIATEKGWTLA